MARLLPAPSCCAGHLTLDGIALAISASGVPTDTWSIMNTAQTRFPVFVVVLASVGAARPPYEDAFTAFNRGDYATATPIYRMLADHGDPYPFCAPLASGMTWAEVCRVCRRITSRR